VSNRPWQVASVPAVTVDPAISAVPARARRAPLSGPRAAISLLTRIPVGRLQPRDAADLAGAAPWFPLVGLVVGGVCAAVRVAAGAILPRAAATVVALAAAVLLTGALHEDGLADTADALGAGGERARRLEVLRDPRIGAFGALALALSLLFSYGALAPMAPERFARAVLVAHCLARFSAVLQSRLLRAARPDGSGVLLRASTPALALAGALALAAALEIGSPSAGAVAVGAAVLLTACGSVAVRRAFGGSTGDTFGAVAKLVELSSYAVFAAFWR